MKTSNIITTVVSVLLRLVEKLDDIIEIEILIDSLLKAVDRLIHKHTEQQQKQILKEKEIFHKDNN